MSGTPSWARFSRIAAMRPAHPAIIEGGAATDFATLHAMAERRAASGGLAGIDAGQRVVIWSRNSAAMAAAILAVWAQGGIPVLLGAQTPPRTVAHAVAATTAVLLVVDPEQLAAARSATDRAVVALDAEPQPGAQAQGAMPAEAGHAGEPASILFTSGSTALPKGVVQSHHNLAVGCDAVANSIGLREADRILCGVPWAFDYGWGQLLSTLLRGVTQILPAAPDAFAVCEAIDRDRPTVLASVPSLLAALTQGVSGIERADLASVRLVTNTGSRIPPGVFQDALRWFGHAELRLNFGLTETYRSTSLDPALARTHPDSVGRAIPGVAITVLGDDGRPVPPGAVGEVVHRGAGVFLGYWGDPDATARTRRPDPLWRHAGIAAPPAVFTGDLGYLDGGGLLHLVGRRDRQIKSMGVRVSPEEIEAVLMASGQVQEAAVLSRPHDAVGDLVIAAVVPAMPGTDPVPALKRFARAELSPFMQPREWHALDALPRNTNGKPDYPALRRRFADVAPAPAPLPAMAGRDGA